MNKWVFVILMIGFIGCTSEEKQEFNEELHHELIAMKNTDQQIRTYIMETYPTGQGIDSVDAARWDSIDTSNTLRLKAIIEKYGWPGFDLVGEEGSNAAWLLAQHADRNPEFQEIALNHMKEAVEESNASAKNFANLIDRVRIRADIPQVYGTQMKIENGEYKPFPIEDSSNVDKRRAEVGLSPLSEYLKRF